MNTRSKWTFPIVVALIGAGCGSPAAVPPDTGTSAGGSATSVGGSTGSPTGAGVGGSAGGGISVGGGAGGSGGGSVPRECTAACETTSLTAAGTSATTLAIDGSALYWAEGGVTSGAASLFSVPLAGGQASPLGSVPNAFTVEAIALDASFLYAATANGGACQATDGVAVARLPKAGGSATIMAAGQCNAVAIAVDATAIYWTNAGSYGAKTPGQPADGAVFSAPLSGLPAGSPGTILAMNQDRATSLHLHAGNLYWSAGDVASGQAAIKTAPAAGGPVTVIAAKGSALAVDDESVFWIADGLILRAPLAGGPPITVATSPNPRHIAVFGGFVYWTDYGSPACAAGAIMSTAKTGGAPANTLTTGGLDSCDHYLDPSAIAVDATAVYWYEGTTGTIKRTVHVLN